MRVWWVLHGGFHDSRCPGIKVKLNLVFDVEDATTLSWSSAAVSEWVSWWRDCFCSRLLESIFVLLCSPATCNHVVVFSAIRSVLMTLMTTQAGLLYLSSKVETLNGILRVLMQNSVSVSIGFWSSLTDVGIVNSVLDYDEVVQWQFATTSAVKMVLFSIVSVCGCVCSFVNARTLEPFEISSWNF